MLTVDTFLRRSACFAGFALLLSSPARASASPPTPPVVQMRFALAEATLETESMWAKKTRLLQSGLAVGLGAATVGVGSVLLGRDATPGGAILVAQGGLALLGGIHGLIWRRDPFEELMREVERTRRQGGASVESVHRLEARWYDLALRERRWRRLQGGGSMALGGLLFGAAAVIAALPGDMDPTLRALYTRSLLGTGVGALGVGLVRLLVPSSLERSYVSFEQGTRSTAFRVSPLAGAGGSGLALGASF